MARQESAVEHMLKTINQTCPWVVYIEFLLRMTRLLIRETLNTINDIKQTHMFWSIQTIVMYYY